MRIGSGDNPMALFYDYSTVEIPRGNGFVISAGLSTLACQVNGLALDYFRPPNSAASQ
jgi:hypothetical protein